MGVMAILNHLFNFSAPALALAVMLPLFARLLTPGSPVQLSLAGQAAVNFAASLAASLGGLWYFGRDGMVATYCAMVVAAASSQWVLQRASKT